MSDLAVQNRESEQEVMPSFDFLLERDLSRVFYHSATN